MASVTAIIDDAREFAADTYENADALISKAMSRISMTYPYLPASQIPDPDVDNIVYESPDDFTAVYEAPTNDADKPSYMQMVTPNVPNPVDEVGDFDKSRLWEGDPPVFDVGAFNKDAPEISEVIFPESPELFPIPYPDLKTPVVPTFDGVAIPEFTAEMLATLPDGPQDLNDAYLDTYNSSLPEMRAFVDAGMEQYLATYCPEYHALRSKLVERINKAYDEGTGLSEAVEQGIYDRGRARAENEQIRVTEAVLQQNAKRGMYVPDGAVNAGLLQAQQTAAMANAQYASETAIERAKLEINHLQFIMGLSDGMGTTAQQMMLQYAALLQQVNAQALGHAQNIANNIVALYNLELKRYEAALSYYQIQAQVYEVQFKAALADLEVFRVEAEVAKLQNDINMSEVQLFIAQYDAQKTVVEIYGIEVSAIQTKVTAEAAAVSAFGQEVQAYKARIDAKTAEYGAYSAALGGNKVQADIYSTEVGAYATKVSAAKTVTDAEISAASAVIGYNQNLTQQYMAELKAYESEISAESKQFDAHAKAYSATLASFKATLDAQKAVLLGQVQVADMELKGALAEYKNVTDFNIQSARVVNEGSKNMAQTAMAGAAVYTDIAGAALASQNTMVTLAEDAAADDGGNVVVP